MVTFSHQLYMLSPTAQAIGHPGVALWCDERGGEGVRRLAGSQRFCKVAAEVSHYPLNIVFVSACCVVLAGAAIRVTRAVWLLWKFVRVAQA